MSILRVVLLVAILALSSCLAVSAKSTRMSQSILKPINDAGSKCVQRSGSCSSIIESKCSTGFVANLCPGDKTIQCCTGRLTPVAPSTVTPSLNVAGGACAAAGGVCMSHLGNSCSTGFRAGMCPGGADVQCCISGVSFNRLKACYPQGEAEEVKSRLGGAVNGDWIKNTCAIRMSQTLNCAGKLIPSLGPETITGRAPTNYKYVFRVRQLSPLVKKMFGQGVTIKATGARGVDYSSLKGRQGIIYFDTTGAWTDASGHFDLWDGEQMVETSHANDATTKRYFSLSVAVTFWEFP